MSQRYEILGVTDAVDTCDCCGKQGLTRAVALADGEEGGTVYFGVDCAAAALKLPATVVRTQAKQAQVAADIAARKLTQKAAETEYLAWLTFLRGATGRTDRSIAAMCEQLGGFAAARAMFRAQVVAHPSR